MRGGRKIVGLGIHEVHPGQLNFSTIKSENKIILRTSALCMLDREESEQQVLRDSFLHFI